MRVDPIDLRPLTAEMLDVTDEPRSRVKVGSEDADNSSVELATTNAGTERCSSIDQVPAPRATLDAIMEFSHTYDAYGVHRSLERISIVARRVWDARAAGSLADCEIDDLRAALFMTQRGWHTDGNLVEPDVGVEWELVEAIHEASGGLVYDDRPILR